MDFIEAFWLGLIITLLMGNVVLGTLLLIATKKNKWQNQTLDMVNKMNRVRYSREGGLDTERIRSLFKTISNVLEIVEVKINASVSRKEQKQLISLRDGLLNARTQVLTTEDDPLEIVHDLERKVDSIKNEIIGIYVEKAKF